MVLELCAMLDIPTGLTSHLLVKTTRHTVAHGDCWLWLFVTLQLSVGKYMNLPVPYGACLQLQAL